MPTRARQRSRRGVSLLEAVAAMAIIGVTAASALAAVGREMRTAERARMALQVEALATQRLDYMALLSDRELQSLPDSVAGGEFDEPLEQFTWKTSVQPVSEQPGLYDVHVDVIWADGTYGLHSKLYRRPLTTAAGRRATR